MNIPKARNWTIRDWHLNKPTAEVYAWVFSQPPETVIRQLQAHPELWQAVCEECALIVDTHATDCETHEGYCYASELRDIAAKIRARGKENES